MKRIIGYILVGLCFLISWPVHLAAYGYGIYYIVKTFLDDGVGSGILSIFMVGFGLWVIEMVIGLITLPLGILAASLVGDEERKLALQEVELERKSIQTTRTGKTTAGAILMIIAGVVGIVVGVAELTGATPIEGIMFLGRFIGVGIVIIVLGLLPIVGGIFALKRQSWGLALAGAIVSILWAWYLGIPSVILIAMGKAEFNLISTVRNITELPLVKGSTQKQRKKSKIRFCPYCGYEITGVAVYCPECGKRISKVNI